MQIFIHTVTGETLTLEIDSSATIFDVKEKIKSEGVLINGCRLIYAGQELEPLQKHLYEFHIQPKSTIHLVLMLRGAMYHESSGFFSNDNFIQ
jgi:ubiquitin C